MPHLSLVSPQARVSVVLQQPAVSVQSPHEHVWRGLDRVNEYPGGQRERVLEAEGHVRYPFFMRLRLSAKVALD